MANNGKQQRKQRVCITVDVRTMNDIHELQNVYAFNVSRVCNRALRAEIERIVSLYGMRITRK